MLGKQKEQISSAELGISMFVFLSSVAMTAPVGATAGNKSWLAIIMGTILALSVTLIYTHLSDSYYGKSIIEIGEILFGRWGGKFIGLLYAWDSLESNAYMLKDNWQMTSTVALPHTPIVVIAAISMAFTVWMTHEGIETIVRISTLALPLLVFYQLVAFILLIKEFDLNYLLPVFDINWGKLVYSAVQITAHPLCSSVIFTLIFPKLEKRGRAKAPALWAVAGAGLLLLISSVMYQLVLGPLASKLTYPGYTVYSFIHVAEFIDRAEVLFYTLFLSINIIEMSIALYSGALCLAKIFGINNYRILLIPLSFLVTEWSTFIVKNNAEHVTLVKYSWHWYAMLYDVLIPSLLLIFSAFLKRKYSS